MASFPGNEPPPAAGRRSRALDHARHEIVLRLERVQRALRAQLAGIEPERRDRETLAAEQVAAKQVGRQPILGRGCPKTAQGHVGSELASLGLKADVAQYPLDAAAQRANRARRILDSDPKRVRRAARRELAQALERQLERRMAHPGQGLADFIKRALAHLADETQGQVEMLRIAPAHARQAFAQVIQRILDLVGWVQGDEQARHGALPGQAGPRPPLHGLAKERRSPYLVALGRTDAVAPRLYRSCADLPLGDQA